MKTHEVDTPLGPGRVNVAEAANPQAVLLLGHGAGGGIDAFDLLALADSLPGRGIAVVRFEQPWKVAGRKVAGPPASLDLGWSGALDFAERQFAGVPLFVGGRSAGARVACRRFAPPAHGVVCLAFPLHLPGKPQSSRIAELAGVAAPILVFQGESDPFGSGTELRSALAANPPQGSVEIIDLPGAHSFAPRTKAAQALAAELASRFADATEGFIHEVIG